MSVGAVAAKDFQDAVRSRALWALSILFVLFLTGATYAFATLADITRQTAEDTAQTLVLPMAGITALFISLTAIIVSYKSIAGERESGSVMLLLGLPHSRRDVVLGKVLGRTGVLVIPTLIGFTAAMLVAVVMLEAFEPITFLLFIAVTVLFAFVYVSIVVGISAMTSSTGSAAALAVAFYFVFELIWGAVSLAVAFVINGFELPAQQPDWMFILNQVSPSNAYTTGLRTVLPDITANVSEIDAAWGSPWFGVAMLAFWATTPLVIGYVRFSRADI